jgi:hypothetical protein
VRAVRAVSQRAGGYFEGQEGCEAVKTVSFVRAVNRESCGGSETV